MTLDLSKLPSHVVACRHGTSVFLSSHDGSRNDGQAAAVIAGMVYAKASLQRGVPMIYLEDDAEGSHQGPLPVIEVPDNADAVYLGLSLFWVAGKDRNFVDIGPDLIQLEGMLSFHAVIPLTKKFIHMVISCACSSIKSGITYDVPLAHRHGEFNIYALKEPLFYQQGVNEGATRITYLSHPAAPPGGRSDDVIVSVSGPEFCPSVKSSLAPSRARG